MTTISTYLYYIIPIGAVIAFLASLTVFFIRGGEPFLKTFPYFLLVNACFDTTTNYMALKVIHNVFIGNVNTLVVISYYLFLLRQIVHGKTARTGILISLILFILVSIASFFIVKDADTFSSITNCLGSLLIVAACVYFFWELFQRAYSGPLSRQPAFWICSGLLFYFTCTFPLYGATNLIKALPKVILQNLLVILISLTILLYLSFVIAFLCRIRIRKSMSSYS
jgi:hypothetical protein